MGDRTHWDWQSPHQGQTKSKSQVITQVLASLILAPLAIIALFSLGPIVLLVLAAMAKGDGQRKALAICAIILGIPLFIGMHLWKQRKHELVIEQLHEVENQREHLREQNEQSRHAEIISERLVQYLRTGKRYWRRGDGVLLNDRAYGQYSGAFPGASIREINVDPIGLRWKETLRINVSGSITINGVHYGFISLYDTHDTSLIFVNLYVQDKK